MKMFSTLGRTLPWLLVALFAAEALQALRPRAETGFHTREFGRLPALLNGRVQPLDSVGRNSLLQIRNTQDVPLAEKKAWEFWKHPKKLRPGEWLLEVLVRPEQADARNIFLIHHPELLGEFKLEGKGTEKSGLHYFTYAELKPVRPEIHEQAKRLNGVDDKLWTPVQKQLANLERGLTIYERLKNSLRPEVSDDFAKELAEFKQSVPAGMAAVRAQQEGKEFDKEALDRFAKPAQHYYLVEQMALPLIVPPAQPEVSRDNWQNAGANLMEVIRGGEVHPAMNYYAQMASAYRQDKPDAFNRAVEEYRQWLAGKLAPELRKSRNEFFFNNLLPFMRAMIAYIFAFLCACAALATVAWARWSEMFRRSAFYLIALAWVIHTFGLVFRMVLEGRPPVTNLYSSAIFIGWGAVLLGLILERIFKIGIGSAVASLAGFITLIIAHNLSMGGDTMEMLRAVLDTNFWLATHVTVITLGYASTYVAGLIAILFIVLGVFTRHLAGETAKILTRMVYGILCFATLFSFTGTVLGGIWADQSWGRFWGWDPKENGALIIVLWNATILHARWGGLVRERGLMNMAVFGNVVTSFSWFGVNMLGIGLHSYGFMDAAFKWLMIFVATQALFMALGLLPLRLWASFRPTKAAPGDVPPMGGQEKPLPSTG